MATLMRKRRAAPSFLIPLGGLTRMRQVWGRSQCASRRGVVRGAANAVDASFPQSRYGVGRHQPETDTTMRTSIEAEPSPEAATSRSSSTHLTDGAVAALGHWIQGKALPHAGRDLKPMRLLLGERLVVELSFHGRQHILADGITGVLYDARTGRCLSSSRLLLDVSALTEVSKPQAQAWLSQRLAASKAKKR